jgi:hypothetical protein
MANLALQLIHLIGPPTIYDAFMELDEVSDITTKIYKIIKPYYE